MTLTELPDTTPALVWRAAERFGDREGLVDDEVRWTFSDLAWHVERAALAFVASGVAHGDRISVWAPNVREWVVVALGAQMVGAVVVPPNTRFKGTEAAHVLRTARSRMLFTVTDFLDTDYVAMLDGHDIADLDETVVLRGTVPPGAVGYADFIARADAVDASAARDRAAAVQGSDRAAILFTSGTTGLPKGAILRHDATVRAYASWADVVGLRAGDRYLIINPFFHSFGLNAGILAALMAGATMVPHLVFDVPSVMDRVEQERISMLPGPPAIYQTMLNSPDLEGRDLSSLRLAVTGAAPIPAEMIEQMWRRLGFENVVTGYGLTEAHGIVSMCRHDDDADTIARTDGRAIPDVEVRVVGDDGVEVTRGEPGEVVVRGYNVMEGYFENPEATAEAIDAEGWLHTGDIAVMDDRGYLTITDRKKDMFIVGGFNAYPAEIESLLLGHPDVGQAAVVGVPDERLGEVGVAFVVAAAGTAPDPDGIVTWAKENMANYKVPRRVEIVEALPLNASNKVLKYELRAQARRLTGPG